MSNQTSDLDKKGTIQYVINVLSKDEKFKSKIEKLNSTKDLSSSYTIALRYGRNYIHFNNEKKRDEFFKECHWLGRKLQREEKKEIMIESKSGGEKNVDIEFISEIEKVDNERECNTEIVNVNEVKDASLINRILEFGVTKLSIEILKECNVNFTIVGSNKNSIVGYLRDYNKIVELIKVSDYVEQK